MLSYQHSYHAGNHADILKHIILGDVVAGMQKKDTPMFMLDGFAGRGIYDLNAKDAQKKHEFDTGVARLWPIQEKKLPEGIQRWKALIESENPKGGFSRLPGSTAMLASMLRSTDRLAACDLHPQEFDALRQGFRAHRRFSFHKRDAYETLRAFLPPKEKRGLIFLDPSFEDKLEYQRVAEAIADIYPHFRAGVYVVWYPILPAGRESDLFRAFKKSEIRNILRIEMSGDFPDMQMQGSGMLIVNPPWHAQAQMKASLAWVHEHLLGKHGHSSIQWLVKE
ncbi:MAG: 23S rRNA (adenine(2030)-N(6))-methyltransferase RlmJ [Zetaproteobacteria bacterium]|nr:23S rRNA (adenine(2030)-N(6))-methyltransferase RlmJ [Zetaproteobacteria bacterium]